jgi:hypothetical protein
MMSSLKINFGPDSAIVKEFKEDEEKRLARKFTGDKVVFKFNKDPDPKDMDPRVGVGMYFARSPYWAEISLREACKDLIAGKPIPTISAIQLAMALDRVLVNKESVKFLYGTKEKSGHPTMDYMQKFYIFQILEEQYSKLEKWGIASKKGGAYHAAKKQLELDKIYKSVYQLKGIRDDVLKEASEDIGYAVQLFYYLEGMGYKATLEI